MQDWFQSFELVNSAKEKWNKVAEIQFVNPIGFIAHLTKKNEQVIIFERFPRQGTHFIAIYSISRDENSPNFMESMEEFRKAMWVFFCIFQSYFVWLAPLASNFH